MKVLWFSVTPSLFSSNKQGHNGGGWIASLERIVTSRSDIQLGVAFISSEYNSRINIIRNNTVYYPICLRRNVWQKFRDRFSYSDIDSTIISKCLDVIADFNPDIIQIFGSEWCFGLLKDHTNIPIVIHMQGCWPPYQNAGLPPGVSDLNEYLRRLFSPKSLLGYKFHKILSRKRAEREEYILRQNQYYMGRTRWDKALISLYAPKAKYFYCSEALRETFMRSDSKWVYKKKNKFIFTTVGGGHYLKGYDMLLKAARLIRKNSNIDFEWRLLGPDKSIMKVFENICKCRCSELNVIPLGRCEADEVNMNLLEADLYIHCAYVDNSPNSICEAQYLGLPVIATNVGGVPSLFSENYPSDMLVPTNDPYYLASKIIEVLHSSEQIRRMSELNYQIARRRHSEDNIYDNLLSVYKQIVLDNENH